jgi:hypothetical protein
MSQRRWWSLVPAVLIMAVFALGVILSGTDKGRGAADQINYHQRVIEQFASQLPKPDLTNYVSATTPLYHLVQAGVYRYITNDLRVLRVLGLAVSLGLLVIVWRSVSASASARQSMALLLPIACSIYVLDPAAWLLPDNAAWCLVALILGTAMGDRFRPRELVVLGAAMAVLVLTRQSHLWAAGVIWAGTFLAAGWRPASPPESGVLLANLDRRVPRTLLAMAATIPAFVIVAYFWKLWGGRLTTPVFEAWYTRKTNPSALPFLLSLTAIYSVFFAGYLLPAFSALIRGRAWLLAAGLIFGIAAWAIAPTNYDLDQGRYGGIWSIARKLPMLGSRSLFILGCSAAGGVMLVCWARALDFRRRWIFLGAVAAFFAAQCVNPWVYQRYCEPYFLILLAIAAAVVAGQGLKVGGESEAASEGPDALEPTTSDALWVIASARSKVIRTLRFFGPIALAGLLLAVSLNELRTAKPVVLLPPGAVEDPPKDP